MYDSGAKPPPELRLAWMCGEHHLPDGGALMDQDYVLMKRMLALENIYNTLTRMRNMKGPEIHSLTVNERRIIRMLREGGYLG